MTRLHGCLHAHSASLMLLCACVCIRCHHAGRSCDVIAPPLPSRARTSSRASSGSRLPLPRQPRRKQWLLKRLHTCHSYLSTTIHSPSPCTHTPTRNYFRINTPAHRLHHCLILILRPSSRFNSPSCMTISCPTATGRIWLTLIQLENSRHGNSSSLLDSGQEDVLRLQHPHRWRSHATDSLSPHPANTDSRCAGTRVYSRRQLHVPAAALRHQDYP